MFRPIPEDKLNNIDPLFPTYKKILHVGTEVARKDVLTLFKAFYLIKKKYKNIKLIRVGSRINSHILKSLNLENDVIYINDVDGKRLREIYNLCDLLIFPSLYEGFGFPGLEAAACGTPVICSDIPVYKELYGDSVIYFPVNNHIELAERIMKFSMNIDRISSKRGLKLAKESTWEKVANQYYNYVMKMS